MKLSMEKAGKEIIASEFFFKRKTLRKGKPRLVRGRLRVTLHRLE